MTQQADWTEQTSVIEEIPPGDANVQIVQARVIDDGARLMITLHDSDNREAVARVWLGFDKPEKFGDFTVAEAVRALGEDPKALAAKGHTPTTLSTDQAISKFWIGRRLSITCKRGGKNGEYLNVTRLHAATTPPPVNRPTTAPAATTTQPPAPPTTKPPVGTGPQKRAIQISELVERLKANGERAKTADGRTVEIWAVVASDGTRFGIVDSPAIVATAKTAKAASGQVAIEFVTEAKGNRIVAMEPVAAATTTPSPTAPADGEDLPF